MPHPQGQLTGQALKLAEGSEELSVYTQRGLPFLLSLCTDHSLAVKSSCKKCIPWVYSELRLLGFPCGSAGKESTCSVGDLGSIPGLGRSPGEFGLYLTPVFWPGEFHGLCSPWVAKNRTWLDDFHFQKVIKNKCRVFQPLFGSLEIFCKSSLGNVKHSLSSVFLILLHFCIISLVLWWLLLVYAYT